jgi:poly(A) polymerase
VPEGECAIRRLASVLPRGSDATKIGKRLKLSTQESLRLGLMLDPAPPLGVHPRAEIYRLGTTTFTDRVLLEAPKHWQELLDLERRWSPSELPVSGADALQLGLKPGPQVGALIDAVERWWVDGNFAADRAACLAELERLAKAP